MCNACCGNFITISVVEKQSSNNELSVSRGMCLFCVTFRLKYISTYDTIFGTEFLFIERATCRQWVNSVESSRSFYSPFDQTLL